MPSLPFLSDGEVQDRTGATLAEMGATVWPAEQTYAGPQGTHYDHTAEVENTEQARDALIRKGNRRLLVDGRTYNVVEATEQQMVDLIACRLVWVEDH